MVTQQADTGVLCRPCLESVAAARWNRVAFEDPVADKVLQDALGHGGATNGELGRVHEARV